MMTARLTENRGNRVNTRINYRGCVIMGKVVNNACIPEQCYFHLRGHCKYGQSCWFQHIETNGQPQNMGIMNKYVAPPITTINNAENYNNMNDMHTSDVTTIYEFMGIWFI